ncbi:MAG TPA: dihydrofolate reductase family protein [Vineibacter sp.]|nr:dihydrofolate reductase family protein [Vineibacter sp.]
MREIIASVFVTLDGVMEAPGGEPGHPHTGWVFDFMSPELLHYKFVEVLEAQSLLIGRVTYESFAEAWPQRSGALADKLNGMPKHVVSTTLRNPGWNATVIGTDVVPAITRLKTTDGAPILVHGSRTLLQTLMAHDLVDEYRIIIFPVVVGSGHRLFPDTPDKTVLRLTASCTFSSGVVVQSYRPATRSSSDGGSYIMPLGVQ